MRVRLSDWLLGDGQLPDPEVGALVNVAVMVNCVSSGHSTGHDAIAPAASPDEDPAVSARLSFDGTVAWRTADGRSAVLRVRDRLFALDAEHRVYPDGWNPEDGDWDDVERTIVWLPDVGNRVMVFGDVSVMAEHELEAGHLPSAWASQIIYAWTVQGITVVKHGKYGMGVHGAHPVDRASASTGIRRPVSFILDLEP